MIKNKSITLVVPCKNEAKIIKAFIRRIPAYIDEIMIIDNNSTDNTADVARKAGARVIRETRHIDGIGYGFAHQTGVAKSTSDYIVAMDGDDTYPAGHIDKIIRYMEKHNLDMVSCNRLPLMNPRAISWVRKLGILILNLETYLLYGYPIKDILTGMWIMNRKAARELQVTSGDWNYSPEIKLAALNNKAIRFDEYHINHFERIAEPSKQNLIKTGMQHAYFILSRRVSDNLLTQYIAQLRQWTVQQLALSK